MSKDIKNQITSEIQSRIDRLDKHKDDEIVLSGNQYDELNQALSKVIGAALKYELTDVKDFVEHVE